MNAPETPAQSAFYTLSTETIVSVSREAFIIAYEVGCRHVARVATTSEERRTLDREEAVEQIADKLVDAFGVLLKALPKNPPAP